MRIPEKVPFRDATIEDFRAAAAALNSLIEKEIAFYAGLEWRDKSEEKRMLEMKRASNYYKYSLSSLLEK